MKTNTNKLKEYGKKCLQKIRLRYLAAKDIRRFSKTASFSIYDCSYDQLCSRIIYNVHAIEKGLSRNENIRLGFGKKALSVLNDALVVYTKNGYPHDSFPYRQGRSIILRYKKFHESKNFDVSFLSEIIDSTFLEDYNQVFREAGIKTIYREEKRQNHNKNFYSLAQNRYSIREFSGQPIDINKVNNAIKNAGKTPSVCNRQGWKVYVVTNKEKMENLLYLQRGFKGYPKLPEVVLAISVSNSTFLSPVERNEAFVDGGLFSMSVIYGLEHEGLAAVPLNAMMNSRDEKDIRKLIEVDDSEQLILFIAIGDFKEETIVPASDRKSVEDYTIHIT